MKLRVLSAHEVRSALPMADAVAAMKQAFAAFSSGQAEVPLRTRLPSAQDNASVLFMPSFVRPSGDLAVKVVSVFPANPAVGLPTIHALVLAIDPHTGQPLALLEGAGLTALRTGAASGAATDLLATATASVLAVFGSGVQARTQLEAVCAVRPIREIRIFSLDGDGARAMAAEMAPVVGAAKLRVAASPDKAAGGAEIVCTATTAASPVFSDAAIGAGAHLNAIGAYTPEMQEVPAETVARARVYVDSRNACLAEAGDLIIPLRQGLITEDAIIAELGEVAAGRRPGRTSPDEITLFKSVGLAAQDAVAAGAILRRAESLGLGTTIEI